VRGEGDRRRDGGGALRRARIARGLTLREVGIQSEGRFTPTAVAGYERGERNISVRRFCELTVFYGIEPERPLAEALHPGDGESVVDLTPFEEPAASTIRSRASRRAPTTT
jgi:transcriptional regulator with XRE-family HTH domain